MNSKYNIYRIKSDGTGLEQITHPAEGVEDTRVYISSDKNMMIYNKKAGKTISIFACWFD